MSDALRGVLGLVALLVIGGLLYLLAPVLTPFLIGALLAYMGDPLADRLEAWGTPRTLAVVVVFLVLTLAGLGLLLVLVPLLERQVAVLVQQAPHYIDWLQEQMLPWVGTQLGLDERVFDLGALKESVRAHWATAGGFAAGVLASLSRSGLVVLGWLANLLLIPVVTFYLLRDWDVLVARLRVMLPRRNEATVVRLVGEADEVLGAFLRGQLLVMLGLATIYAVGLSLVGLDLALLIGIAAGLVSFVPYLGFIVGIVAAVIAALVQFHELYPLLWVFAVFGIGQLIEGTVLTPLLVGDRIGLHPVAVIFAVLAGGQLFGFMGVLLALPVAAVVMVFLRHWYQRYRDSALYGH